MTALDLLTVADCVELLVNGLNSGDDHRPVVKLFTSDGSATWLISESDPDEPDRLFGLCDLGMGCPEIGYVSISEIQSVKGHLGLAVARDMHFVADKPLSAYAAEAHEKGHIVA